MRHWLNEIERMHEEMDRMMAMMRTGDPKIEFEKHLPEMPKYRNPFVNQFETKTALVTEVELPGVDKKDIQLNIADDYAEVKVEKKADHEEKEKGYYKFESRTQSYYRRIPFPIEVKSDQSNAEFKDGILRIEAPKAKLVEERKVKRLEIK